MHKLRSNWQKDDAPKVKWGKWRGRNHFRWVFAVQVVEDFFKTASRRLVKSLEEWTSKSDGLRCEHVIPFSEQHEQCPRQATHLPWEISWRKSHWETPICWLHVTSELVELLLWCWAWWRVYNDLCKQRIFFTNQVTTQSGQKRGVRLVRLGY